MNETENMKKKVKDFLNKMSMEEFRAFWRFLRTKTWAEWLTTRMGGRQIDAD